jgi:O-antigen ligase
MITIAYAALWFFVFSVPWENVLVIPGFGIISKLMGMVALALALLAAVTSGRLRRWHAAHVAGLLFVIWTGVGVIALHTQGIPKKFYTFIELFLVLWMIWELARSERRLLWLLTAYVFGAYVAALDTVLVFRRSAAVLRRFAASDFDANDLAMTLALALPMAWYLGMTHPRPLLRWICRGYVPIGLVAIGLTASRGGMVASMIGLLIVPLSMTKLTPGRLVMTIALLGISGALAVAYIPQKVVQRLSTTGEQVQELKFGGRFKLWVGGMNAFVQQPIMGYGAATYKQAITPWLGSLAQVAHNSYLSVLVEEGVVGFALYGMMFVSVLLALLNLPPPERRFALILFVTLATAMLPLTWEDRKPVWCILGILLGLSQAWGGESRPAVPVPAAGRIAPAIHRPLAARAAGPSGRRLVDRDSPG